MNRADLLLSCLRDGRPWTRRDIFEHTGGFFLLNNAAAELRDRGLTVRWSRSGSLHIYQMVGSLGERVPERTKNDLGRMPAEVGTRSPSDSLTTSALVPKSVCSLPHESNESKGSAALDTARPTSAEQLSLLVAA